jgi:hypothetical protein
MQTQCYNSGKQDMHEEIGEALVKGYDADC